jgi:hypothetical protein
MGAERHRGSGQLRGCSGLRRRAHAADLKRTLSRCVSILAKRSCVSTLFVLSCPVFVSLAGIAGHVWPVACCLAFSL